MKTPTLLCLAIALLFSSPVHADPNPDFNKYIEKVIARASSIKPRQTRKDLMLVFTVEGGLSSPVQRRYVYKDCPYIKVDVEFRPVKGTGDKLQESPEDPIVSISKPFLELPVTD